MLNSTNDYSTKNESDTVEHEEDLYRALWLSVILQALADAKNKSAKGKRKLDKLRALAWLAEADNPDSDFAQVCHYAGVDCARMKKRIDCILAEQKESVDFRCLKKTKIEKSTWRNLTKSIKKTHPYHLPKRKELHTAHHCAD